MVDHEPPTLSPCVCDELANGKRSHTIAGAYRQRDYVFERFIWNDCPRHGGFHGWRCDSWNGIDDPAFYSSQVRDWMWEEATGHSLGYRFGCEPPWEPGYMGQAAQVTR